MEGSTNKTGNGERKEAVAWRHDQFIDRQRLALLRYLDGQAPRSTQEPDALAFVENVLTAWEEGFGSAALPEPSLEERTFWFALYMLEELVEASSPQVDPFEKFLLKKLMEAREMLRDRRSLPAEEFMATRPDGS